MADADTFRPPGSAQRDARRASDSSPVRVALALGSGGARGYAHIRVIHGSFEVMNRTIEVVQAALARHTLAAYPPDSNPPAPAIES